MLTFFSAPKPFHGHIGVIQRNALQSWVQLSPPCEIILFGDEEGIDEAAARFSVQHVPGVLRNQYGTPLLNSLFEKAQATASYGLMCYINTDIILMGDFIRTVEHLHRLKGSFLMVGRRLDINLEQSLNFEKPNWEEDFRTYVRQYGKPRPPNWIDYFVFPRGFYNDIPPFAIGRPAFDNWLLWKARSLGAPLVDASEAIMAVHQNHDYSHHPQKQKGVWEGLEAQRNRKLMGGWHHCFTLADATHRLTSAGLELNLGAERLIRMVWTRRWHCLMAWTRPLRHQLGLRKLHLDHLSKVIRRAFNTSSE